MIDEFGIAMLCSIMNDNKYIRSVNNNSSGLTTMRQIDTLKHKHLFLSRRTLPFPFSNNLRSSTSQKGMPNILLFLLFPALSDGYKILVYSTTFSKSHIVSNARIADVLALDGHDVVGSSYIQQRFEQSRLLVLLSDPSGAPL